MFAGSTAEVYRYEVIPGPSSGSVFDYKIPGHKFSNHYEHTETKSSRFPRLVLYLITRFPGAKS